MDRQEGTEIGQSCKTGLSTGDPYWERAQKSSQKMLSKALCFLRQDLLKEKKKVLPYRCLAFSVQYFLNLFDHVTYSLGEFHNTSTPQIIIIENAEKSGIPVRVVQSAWIEFFIKLQTKNKMKNKNLQPLTTT